MSAHAKVLAVPERVDSYAGLLVIVTTLVYLIAGVL